MEYWCRENQTDPWEEWRGQGVGTEREYGKQGVVTRGIF